MAFSAGRPHRAAVRGGRRRWLRAAVVQGGAIASGAALGQGGALVSAAALAQGGPPATGVTGRARAGTPGVAPAPAVPGARYRPTFADEFDVAALDRINEHAQGGVPGAPAWRSRMRHPRKDVINEEKQIYVDPAYAGRGDRALGVQPFEIRDGALHLVAQPVASERIREALHGMRYTSGCITSELTHAQRYGYFEMRARLPRGRGFWPAFWLLPVREGWPPEIDIMEASGERPGYLHFSVRDPGDPRGRGSGWRHVPAGPDGWQVFGCEWTERSIRFIVDGRMVWQVDGHAIHEPMYLVANLALGSHDRHWIPDPDASTPFPGRFEIDYIRAFERA